ncbi:hypothetical protein BT69DRAFT_450819 [Atractiella rhizophila]|nr:hypothetical protein BT69DRAFT_450819 [Atractiella rhizophila]
MLAIHGPRWRRILMILRMEVISSPLEPQSGTSQAENLPRWASRLYSSKVTTIACARLKHGQFRVLLGCENGEVWVFGDIQSSVEGNTQNKAEGRNSYVDEAKERLSIYSPATRNDRLFSSSQVSLSSLVPGMFPVTSSEEDNMSTKPTFSTLLTLPSNPSLAAAKEPKKESSDPNPSSLRPVSPSPTSSTTRKTEFHHSLSTSALQLPTAGQTERPHSPSIRSLSPPPSALHSHHPHVPGSGHRHKASVTLGLTEVDIQVAASSRRTSSDESRSGSVAGWITPRRKEEGGAIGSLLHATQSASGGAASKEAAEEVGGGQTREEDGGAKIQSIFLGANAGKRQGKGTHSHTGSALHLLGESRGNSRRGSIQLEREEGEVERMRVRMAALTRNETIRFGTGKDPEDEDDADDEDEEEERPSLKDAQLLPIANVTSSTYGSNVIKIKVLKDGEHAIMLYEDGDLAIIDAHDGQVLSTATLPSGQSRKTDWRALNLLETDSGCFAFVRAELANSVIPVNLTNLRRMSIGKPIEMKHIIVSSTIFSHRDQMFYSSLTPQNHIFVSPIVFNDDEVELAEPHDAGDLAGMFSYRHLERFGESFIASDQHGLLIYRIEDQTVVPLKRIDVNGLKHAVPIGDRWLYTVGKDFHEILEISNETNDGTPDRLKSRLRLLFRILLQPLKPLLQWKTMQFSLWTTMMVNGALT